VCAFEKMQKAVKNRVAAIETPAPGWCISFQPSPLAGETADVSLWIRFTATEMMRKRELLTEC
jgi:hypothetical protein